MTFNAWTVFQTEIGLVLLAMGALVFDILHPDDEKRGRTLAAVAMIGVAMLFFHGLTQWGDFGAGAKGTLVQDGVSFFFKLVFLPAAFLALFMAREYQDRLKRGHEEFVLLILFALVGMVFVACAADLLLLFIALETVSVSMYVMTAYLRDRESSIEAGVKYVVLGALSTAVFLYGLSFLYGATGSTQYGAIAAAMADGPTPAYLFGLLLVFSSLAFKIAAVPFHLWAPDVYEGAPAPVTAYLAIGSKAAGFAAIVRLASSAFAPAGGTLALLAAVIAALTIVYGNLGAIPQTNMKRLMGYSSIGHAGYLLIGLAAFPHSGREAMLVYLLSYLVSNGAVFLVIVFAGRTNPGDAIAGYAGLSRRSPLLAASMLLGLLSLAGVPPLAGFFAKFYLLWAGMKAELVWLVAIGVANVITSLYYYLKVVKVMYVDKPADETPIRLSLDQKVILYLMILGILVLGVYQGPFVRLAQAAFSS